MPRSQRILGCPQRLSYGWRHVDRSIQPLLYVIARETYQDVEDQSVFQWRDEAGRGITPSESFRINFGLRVMKSRNIRSVQHKVRPVSYLKIPISKSLHGTNGIGTQIHRDAPCHYNTRHRKVRTHINLAFSNEVRSY